jgi:hypothetical protein
VLVLEDLAAAFELRVQDAIARVRALEELGCVARHASCVTHHASHAATCYATRNVR